MNLKAAFEALSKGVQPGPIETPPADSEPESMVAPVELSKGADNDVLSGFIVADDLFKAELELLDANTVRMEKALNGALQSNALLIKALEAQHEESKAQLTQIYGLLEAMSSAPARVSGPARSQAEAALIKKSVVNPQVIGTPAESTDMSRGEAVYQISQALLKGFETATDPAVKADLKRDIVFMESASVDSDVDIAGRVLPRLTVHGKNVVESLIQTEQR